MRADAKEIKGDEESKRREINIDKINSFYTLCTLCVYIYIHMEESKTTKRGDEEEEEERER